ncbi:MAG TPA: PhzF family phenazine biosynthesis protein [Acidimicrobiales bacterium]|nr:PhzF family phenazine biosynthesis protein [Acidimicrobiales bacterium]
MKLDYHLLDVFTRQRFTGNPLAVFVDQEVVDAERMQSVARELNLSETVFVSRPVDAPGWPTRIFTPSNELPFAGHPTVGTAVLLGSLGLASQEVVLAEGVGDVRVGIVQSGDGVWSGELSTATLPVCVETLTPETAAAALDLAVEDLHPGLVPAVWDCGVAFAVIAVRDVATLARARGVPVIAPGLYVVAPVENALGATWRARAFAPTFGIAEDPATGSAAAAFAGVLAQLDALAGVDRFEITQGVEMGRRSELVLSVDRSGEGALVAVRVGGEAVVIGGGTLRL